MATSMEHPTLRWGAVFAGWFVATGTALLLYSFGMAIGFSAFDPRNAAAVAHGASAGAVAWVILTWAASLWTGGMFASWFDGRNDTEMGVVRGLTVWGLSLAAAGLVIASGLTHAAFITSAAGGTAGSGAPAVDPTQAAHYLAALMWTAFGSAVASLVTSALGGWMGAHHVHRVYHLRQYAEHR
ncbi:MAG TPA: hypothetical protein VMU52_02270 [Steroidobacteraceae bacterium]|nr:hypothetical protein [Steroidobacteraceae bacterium]